MANIEDETGMWILHKGKKKKRQPQYRHRGRSFDDKAVVSLITETIPPSPVTKGDTGTVARIEDSVSLLHESASDIHAAPIIYAAVPGGVQFIPPEKDIEPDQVDSLVDNGGKPVQY